MNSKHPDSHNFLPALILISLHLAIILLGGYFLSPEFTLYPYLVSRGFLPYANIIDQHFPSLIFGPFSFPSWFTVNPQPLLTVFCSLTALTDLFLFLSLVRRGIKSPQVWLLAWIVVSYWFSGNTLWLESFITFYLAIILFLGRNDKPMVSLFLGFLFSLILLVKPTLLPFLILLFIYQKLILDRQFITGFTLPLLVTLLFLTKFSILSDFFNLTYAFNRDYYSKYATKIPSLRQIIETSIVFLPPLLIFIRRSKYLPSLLILSAIIPAFPRFEYIHLQPALLAIFFLVAGELSLAVSFLIPICITLLTFFLYRNLRHNFGNFYLDKQTLRVAAALKSRPGIFLFVMGGNDLLYPLSNRVPPGLTYLPPLPWYWKNESFAQKAILSLTVSPEALVLIKNNATIDGVNIDKSTGLIGKFIKDNYQEVEIIENYRLYQRILK